MHSTSSVTWSAKTSATLRGSVMAGSGRRWPHRPPTASGGSTARAYTPATAVRSTGAPRAANTASSGWGEAPLGVEDQDLAAVAGHPHAEGHGSNVIPIGWEGTAMVCTMLMSDARSFVTVFDP